MAALLVFCLIQLSVSAYSMLGGLPERIMGGMLLAATVLTISASNLTATPHEGRLAVLMVDNTLFVAMVAVALKANRFWPIWVAGIHATTLPMHMLKVFNPALLTWVHAIASAVTAFPILLILVIATTRHRTRVRLFGTDPPWRDSAPPWPPGHETAARLR